jgi:hypothetical protein
MQLEGVDDATGRTWDEWRSVLDGWRAGSMNHQQIARRLQVVADLDRRTDAEIARAPATAPTRPAATGGSASPTAPAWSSVPPSPGPARSA